MRTLRRWILGHRIVSLIAAIAIAGGGYYWYSSSQSVVAATRYVVETATQGSVVTSIAGSGQVDSVTQVDVKPKVTETVTKILVGVGDHVAAGQLLVQLDTTNEAKALRQAQLSLQSSQLALAKLQQPPDTLSLTQSQNAVTQAAGQLATASTTLQKDYQSGFDSVSGSFVDFQTLMSQLQDFVAGTAVNKNQDNPDAYVSLMPTYLQASTIPYRDDVFATYQAANTAYQANLKDYQAASRYSDPAALDTLFAETYNTAKLVGGAVKSVKSLLDFLSNNYPKSGGYAALPAITNTYQTNFGADTGTANGDVTSLANAVNTIANDKMALNNAALSLTEAQQSLAKLQAGADPLDIQSQQLSIEQQQLSVQTAQDNLDACSLRAPIDGIVSSLPAVVGATVPSPAVSVVGGGKIAEITLNEVDAAKVSVGDKATLTFDAINGLSLAGQVAEIDPVGTVSQGVVSYNVKVGFAEAAGQDQIKPGMSVSANIVTEVHQNVIALPNAAILGQGSSTYVLAPATALAAGDISASATGGIELPEAPKRIPVVVGISNDTVTEIVSGVNAGDQVITKTIGGSASAARTTTASTNTLRLGGGLFGGGATGR